ncbi:MAG: EAL domain-containing protein [Sphaerochaetaceae bacterium]|nr:EAL domain-containing protein [Sphaerochaetaceae bacterium]
MGNQINILLVLRTQIFSLLILAFIFYISRFYKLGKDNKVFLRLTIYGFIHAVYDLLSVLCANKQGYPPFLAKLAYVIFCVFSVLCAYEFLCYTVEICRSRETSRAFRKFGKLIPLSYFITIPFHSIEIIQGNGINYCIGLGPESNNVMTFLIFLTCFVYIIVSWDRVEKHKKATILPLLFLLIIVDIVQIYYPEFLFSGATMSLIILAFFFGLENPSFAFQKKSLFDAMTGVENRNSYQDHIIELERDYSQGKGLPYGIVFCDINNLKMVNNVFGHQEGDIYIAKVASIIKKNLQGASHVYRMGGDEFLAIYKGKKLSQIEEETSGITKDCEIETSKCKYTFGISMGCAITGPEFKTIGEVIKIADYRMYLNKSFVKSKEALTPTSNIFLDENGNTLNISGLTSRVFDGLAITGGLRRYPFIINRTTGVFRVSPQWVKTFEISNEYSKNFVEQWVKCIHPDDRQAYLNDINDVTTGKKPTHNLIYRVRTRMGEYITVKCHGTILPAVNGNPELFVGTMEDLTQKEEADLVTGLQAYDQLFSDITDLIRLNKQAILLEIGIISFGRVNMVYNHEKGNEILIAVSELIRKNIGYNHSLYRVEGSRFIVCLTNTTEDQARTIYNNICKEAKAQTVSDAIGLPLSMACGAFPLEPGYDGNLDTIRSNLVYTLGVSKDKCRGEIVFAKPFDKGIGNTDSSLLSRIHQDALKGKENFLLRYQPIARLDTGEIVGAEALIRWIDRDSGKDLEIYPASFIDWLEQDSIYYNLGLWILRTAISDIKPLLATNPDFQINVNITANQLLSVDFLKEVLAILKETAFPSRNLCLELTERCKALDTDTLKPIIEQLQAEGLLVALDDVGTGSASLVLTTELEFDEVKIDRAFVSTIMENPKSKAIIETILHGSSMMKYKVCFEGVENQEVLAFLKQYGNALYQGYFFCEPILIEELKENLKK